MIMVYAMVFGAHLFPYSWLYKSISYKVVAIIIPVISLALGCMFNSGTVVSLTVCKIELLLVVALCYELKKVEAFRQ